MTAVSSNSAGKVANPAPLVKYVNGLFELQNGKKYKVTHLRLKGKDIIGGKAPSGSEKLLSNPEVYNAVMGMISAVLKDTATRQAFATHQPEFFRVNVNSQADAPVVNVSGRVANATTDAFNTTVPYANVKGPYLALEHAINKISKSGAVPTKTPPPAAVPAKSRMPAKASTPKKAQPIKTRAASASPVRPLRSAPSVLPKPPATKLSEPSGD